MRYGNWSSVVTKYSSPLGIVYHGVHVTPPSSVIAGPWSAPMNMRFGLVGSIHIACGSSPPGAPLIASSVLPPSVER